MDGIGLVTGSAFASLVLEGIKYVLRHWILHNVEYDFPLNFYLVAIPVLNILVTPLLAYLGFEGFTIPTDWLEFFRTATQVLIASLITVFVYKNSIKPLKEHQEELDEGK